MSFKEVPQYIFSKNQMELDGRSEHSGASEGNMKQGYQLVCQLSVISRVDSLH